MGRGGGRGKKGRTNERPGTDQELRANERPWKNCTKWGRHPDIQTSRQTDMVTLWLNRPSGADSVKSPYFLGLHYSSTRILKIWKVWTLVFGKWGKKIVKLSENVWRTNTHTDISTYRAQRADSLKSNWLLWLFFIHQDIFCHGQVRTESNFKRSIKIFQIKF